MCPPPAATYMRPGAGLVYIIYAGTGMCVHIPFRLNPIASLAWLGKQPCNIAKFYISTDGTDTHTHTLDKNGSLYDPAGTES